MSHFLLILTLSMGLFCPLFGENSPGTTTRLWLGTVSGEIQPLAEKVHLAHTDGTILFLKKEGESVEPHDHWAVFNPEGLALKKRNIELAERDLKYKLRDIDLNREQEEENLAMKLAEKEEELLKLQQLLVSSQASEFISEIKEATETLEQTKRKLRAQYAEKLSPQRKALEKEKLALKMDEQRNEYKNTTETAYKKAGVAGKISYLLPKNSFLPNEPAKARINGAQPVALIRNDESVLVVVPEASFERPLSLQASYFARVTTESGMIFSATLLDRFVQLDENKTTNYYRFIISEGDLITARATIGEKAFLNVMQEFEQPCTLIKKETLIREHVEFIREKGWEAAVLKLHPEMKILAIGKSVIAMGPK